MANSVYSATTSSTTMISEKISFFACSVTGSYPVTLALNESGSAVYGSGIVLQPGQPFTYDSSTSNRWIDSVKVIASGGSSNVAYSTINY